MQQRTINKLVQYLIPRDNRNIWQWAESDDGIDFSRVVTYDCAYKRKFSIDLLPFWKEPLNNVLDLNCREQIILKPARAGGSMTLLETTMRHSIACRPQSILYITGSKESAESFFKLRICKGMKLSPITEAKYKAAKVYDTTILFPESRLMATYPGNKMFGKSDAWSLILADEISAYFDPAAIAALRTRQVTVPFSHLILISSPDANQPRNSNDDPIHIEYEKGDMREWFCKDPKTGNKFVFKMGSRKGNEPGLKISQDAKNKDGSWNMNTVRRDVYFLTPDKTRIYEKNRMDVVRTGKWIPTRKDMENVEPNRKSYHLNAFLMPWITLGELACRWIEAVETSKSEVRSFIMNYLAEPYYESKIQLRGNEVIYDRCGNYKKNDNLLTIDEYKSKYEILIKDYKEKNKDKEKVTPNPVLILTGDVQKTNLYALARLWFNNGDSYLIDWASVPTFSDYVAFDERLKPYYCGIDINYRDRAAEATDICWKHRMIAMVGSKARMKNRIDITLVDPYQGTKYGGKHKITQIMFDSSFFKDLLFELINNQRKNQWYIYDSPENEYVQQLNSERKIDGKWEQIKNDNHALDCEIESLVIAYHLGFINPQIGET